jgi:hypothetical protein
VRLAEQVWRGGTLLHRPGIYLVDPRSLTVKVERLEPAVPGC